METTSKKARRAAVCACTMGISLMAFGSQARAQNMLSDPGFEVSQGNNDASMGDVFGANGWNAFGGGTYTASEFFDGPPALDGSQTFKTFAQYNGGQQTFDANIGQTFTATVWCISSTTANGGVDVQTPGDVAGLELDFYIDSGGDGPNYNVLPTIVGGGPANGGSPVNTWEEQTLTITVPTPPEGDFPLNTSRFQINHVMYTGGAAYWDDASLTTSALWNGGGSSANFSDANNFSGSAATAGEELVFAGTKGLTAHNDLPADTLFAGIVFPINAPLNSVGVAPITNATAPTAGSFTITGNEIQMAGDLINNSGNPQTVDIGLALQQNINISTGGVFLPNASAASGYSPTAAGNINIGGNISGTFGINIHGTGTVTLSGSNSYSGGTIVSTGTLVAASDNALPSGGALTLGTTAGTTVLTTAIAKLAVGSGHSTVSALTINPGSTLDIANNSLAIDYGSGNTSPLAAVQAAIGSGYNGGGWNGTGIISSSAAANSAFAVGYADGSLDHGTTAGANEVLIKYALVGDANLDGGVNITDLLTLLNNYTETGKDWSEGDFNYDGAVNITDLLAMLNNYGLSGGAASSTGTIGTIAVPEPATISLLAVVGAGMLSRRRRMPVR
jgi:autotransporter-associated beta strand protein